MQLNFPCQEKEHLKTNTPSKQLDALKAVSAWNTLTHQSFQFNYFNEMIMAPKLNIVLISWLLFQLFVLN